MRLNAAVACLLGLILVSPTHAGLISHNGYTRDQGSDVVVGAGLEWLHWGLTVGDSIDTALSTYAGSGWRLASNREMANLFNAFSFGTTFTDSEEDYQQLFVPWGAGDADSPFLDFIELFGPTYFAGAPNWNEEDPVIAAAAFYGSDLNGNSIYKYANVNDDWSLGTTFKGDAVVQLRSEAFGTMAIQEAAGVALVRDTVMPVSAPNSIFLFGLALLGLGLSARKRKN